MLIQFLDATVQSVIDYSAAVWGTKSISSISAVQNCACRFFLGLGRYAPNAAVNGDMGWPAPEHRQWMCITRKWCRLVNLDESLITEKVFKAHLDQGNPRHKTWCYRVKMFYQQIELDTFLGDRLTVRATLISVNTKLHVCFETTSARPEVRGTADVGWRSLFPLPLNPHRTHSRLYHITCVYGPTGSDGHERKDTDAALRTIFV